MAWSIAEVARMSKVTSRTLRHYDAIGLLEPAWIGGNGYRYYEREQVLRLQQILLLRELGLGLETVREVLDGRHRTLDVLRNHERWLRAEQERLVLLATTVSRTIEEMEGGDKMKMEELFDGFDANRQARYEAELVERFGEGAEQHIAGSKAKAASWTKADADRFKAEWQEIGEAYAAQFGAKVAADAPELLELVDRHYRWVCLSWTPDRESFTGLGQLYVDSPEFKAQFDARAEGLAEYARDAMSAYARARL
ncbi:TipAS antibiotic-recognition domain-containing protein [Umezawaea sp. Da 62-37]|uniref:MerR family transcriptional regulator n=1 Tax=Umezawaea sp. Da 62-37 TaxID=3075927 RepID=UPI0028F705D5|nr:TipAS antibiotic-recognition domain-containing protein [Umezawaea sp. Da 62-37]WNV91087.1 TipAS antibiotic-recognition domain-containing protein [Umezawaea sp. Da 62-37]